MAQGQAAGGGSPAATSSPILLAIATTVSVIDDTPTDLFAGQAAPQASTMVVPAGAVNIGGIRWFVGGTLLNNSGGNRIFTLSILFGGVTIYSDSSQIMGTNAVARVWTSTGMITRKGPLLGWLINEMHGNNGATTGPTTGIGPIDSVGSGLSPALPHANAEANFACDWSINNRIEFRVNWTTVAANTVFSISGGYIERFGS
jgi:hypothetical protein